MKLVMLIATSGFFFGMIFRIIYELEEDILGSDFISNSKNNNDAVGYFEHAYEMKSKTMVQEAIALTYFGFTSLSTVGFGDYNPKSNVERIFIALALLFGVAIFSYIMGNFIEILDSFKLLTAEIGEGEKLAQFFGILRKFNRNKEVDLQLRREIEKFLQYKWDTDSNYTFDSNADIVSQIPIELIDAIYSEYFFSKFMEKYAPLFEVPKNDSGNTSVKI